MSQKLTVLVTGATGTQGGGVARKLLAAGHTVRALTRKPEGAAAEALRQLGAEIVAGHFDDGASIERAARGADTMYLVGTPYEGGAELETRQGITGADAAKAAGVGHLVYASVSDADQKTGIPHFDSKARIEEHIAGLGIPWTVVAPVFFMENLAGPWWGGSIAKGQLPMALPADRKLQHIAAANIAAFTALAITRRESMFGRRINIAGDELAGNELAPILSQATGHQVDYVALPPAALRGNPMGDDLATMFEWFDRVGYSADVEGLRRDYPEVGWLRVAEWAPAQNWSAAPGAAGG